MPQPGGQQQPQPQGPFNNNVFMPGRRATMSRGDRIAYARNELRDAHFVGDGSEAFLDMYDDEASVAAAGTTQPMPIVDDNMSTGPDIIPGRPHSPRRGISGSTAFTMGPRSVNGGSIRGLEYDGHDSRTTFSFGDGWDTADPALLFSILEEAIPKAHDLIHNQSNSNNNGPGGHPSNTTLHGGANQHHHHPQSAGEMQLKRDHVEFTWERIRRWMWANPTPEERQAAAYIRGQADATPLHLVCKLYNPPEDVVQALVEAAPDTVSWTDSHGWLPLHHACANGASPEVLKLLLQVYPEGKVQQDNQKRTPLHFYATRNMDNPALMALNAEMLTDTGAAELTDLGGMLPMHYACAYGTHPAVLEVLANVYPLSLTAKENHGRTPMHLAMVNAHRDASPNVIRFLLEHDSSRMTINTRDKDGYLPLHLLALGLKGYKADDPDKRTNVSECLKMYLAAEPDAGADFLTAIQDLPDWLQDTAVVSRHVRNVLNEKIVQRFPTSILMLDGVFLMILIVCFGLTTRNHINIRFGAPGTVNDTNGALAVLFVGGAYFLVREVVQVISLISLGSLSSWWNDSTNWLDMTVIVLVFYYGILMLNDDFGLSNEAFRSGAAFTQGILWVAVILFLKSTLVDFAVFVGGVVYVVQRLVAFLIAVGVILLAFAQMFYFVYVDTELCGPGLLPGDPGYNPQMDCLFPHCTFDRSLFKVYTMMMGEINNVARYSTNLTAQILFVGYAFLVVILLSNVLIAIVTDSYEIIQNDRAAIVFWSNRLDFVAEMDAISYALMNRMRFCCAGSHLDPYLMEVADALELQQQQLQQQQLQQQQQQQGLSVPSQTPHRGGGQYPPPPPPTSTPSSGHLQSGENQESAATGNYVMPHHDQDRSTHYFREAWHQVMMLFDANLYDEIDWCETWVYNIFRIFCIFIVIPLWLAVGFVTAGWLWPPQVREYLFAQKETAISRAELERQKLETLKTIENDLRGLKQEMIREMASDRDEMVRMRTEVESIQSEVLADLMQIKELMGSLLLE